MTRVEELEKFIEQMRLTHAREIGEERARTKAAEFDAEIGRWAVKGMAGYAVRLMLPDFAQLNGDDILRVADYLGKNAANELLHGTKLAFKEHAEFYRAMHHIHYLENHARNRGVEFTPFQDLARDTANEMIPKPWDWPTRQTHSQRDCP